MARHPQHLHAAERRIAQAVVDDLMDPETHLTDAPLWRMGEVAGYRNAKRDAWMALHGRRRDGVEEYPGLLRRGIVILLGKSPRLPPYTDTPPNVYRVDLAAARLVGILPRPILDASDEFAQLRVGILPPDPDAESSAVDFQHGQSRGHGGSYPQNSNGDTCWCSSSSSDSLDDARRAEKADPDKVIAWVADAKMKVNWTRANRRHLDAWLARYSMWQLNLVLLPYVKDRCHSGNGEGLLLRLLADGVLPSLEKRRRTNVDPRRTTERARREYAKAAHGGKR